MSSYNKAANPNTPAPIAPSPIPTWFAAPVGLAVALAADALAALAADEAEELALEAAELTDAEALDIAELMDALALEAFEERLPETELADAAAPVVPLDEEVQVAEAGWEGGC